MNKEMINFISEFITKINNLHYCVLRNYEGLPENPGNDLDILVLRKDISRISNFIKIIVRRNNLCIINIKQLQGYLSYVILFQADAKPQYFQIDIWWKFNWHGYSWYDAETVLKCRKKYQKFWIPQEIDEAIITLMKELIPQGKTLSRYHSRIKSLLRNNREKYLNRLKPFLNKPISSSIYKNIQENDWKEIESHHTLIKDYIIKNSWMKKPFGQFACICSFIWKHIFNFFGHPFGIMVVLIGPDGSGKSSIVNEMKKEYLRLPFRKIQLFHGHFQIIPRLRKYSALINKLINSKESYKIKEISRIDYKERSIFNSLIVILYHTIDFFIGRLLLYYYRQRGDLIIFDRYFYDYFIQSEYNKTPFFIKKFLSLFVPPPDLLILLKANSNVIYNRKKDITLDEIKRQQDKFPFINQFGKYNYVIETDHSPVKSTNRVYYMIASILK